MNFSLKALFLKYKTQISFTFILLTLESCLLAIIPFGIGLSIDSLKNDSGGGLYILLAIFFSILVISTSRRLYDTRIYSKIYALLCTSLIKNYKKEKINNSIIVARSSLIKELVDFFEHDLTEAYTSIITISGALVMILYLNSNIFILCFISTIIIGSIYKISENEIYEKNEELNNELEKRLTIINNRNIFIIPHLKKITKSMIKLSDIESYNYIFIQILISLVLIATLFIGIESGLSTGSLFAILTYVLNFSFEILTLPIIFQQFIRLKEITTRINKGQK